MTNLAILILFSHMTELLLLLFAAVVTLVQILLLIAILPVLMTSFVGCPSTTPKLILLPASVL